MSRFQKLSIVDVDTEKGHAGLADESPLSRRTREVKKQLWADRPLAVKVGIVLVSLVIVYNLLLKPVPERRGDWKYGSPKVRSLSSRAGEPSKVPTPKTVSPGDHPRSRDHWKN